MTTLKVDDKHRFSLRGKMVNRIISPYTGGKFDQQPSHTVIHFTYGGSAESSAHWFRDPNNKYKSSAHVVIGRDGEIIQCVDLNVAANHAGQSFWRGRSGLNSWSFGIELANWGYLRKQPNSWSSWTGQSIPSPILAAHKNGNPDGSNTQIGWEPYPAVQIEAAASVVRALNVAYGKQEILGHDDISVGRKWDPGPAFDMSHFKQLSIEDSSDSDSGILHVWTPSDSLNLRTGPGTQFEISKVLDHGTLLNPIKYEGIWILVNVLNEKMHAIKTGWVNSNHTRRK